MDPENLILAALCNSFYAKSTTSQISAIAVKMVVGKGKQTLMKTSE